MLNSCYWGANILLNQTLLLVGFLSFLGFIFFWWKQLEVNKIIKIHKKSQSFEKTVDELISKSSSLSHDLPFFCQLIQSKKQLQSERSCLVESKTRSIIYKKNKVYGILTYFSIGFSIALFLTLAFRCL